MTDAMKKRLLGVVAVLAAMGALAWISSGSMGENLARVSGSWSRASTAPMASSARTR